MKKLNRETLKKLIVETLQEVEIPEPDPRGEMTGTAYADVRAGMESEPQPEDFEPETMSLQDIAGYFHKVADELNSNIEKLKNTPKPEIKRMSDEEVKAGLEEMKQVQQELADIQKNLSTALAGLKK
jgi:hypothetical protein